MTITIEITETVVNSFLSALVGRMERFDEKLDRILNAGSITISSLGDLSTAVKTLTEKEDRNMSAITDWAAKEQADLTTISTTLDGVVTGIAALDQMITNFQNSPGALSPSDQAALDAIQAASGALVSKSAAISTTPPAPPAGS